MSGKGGTTWISAPRGPENRDLTERDLFPVSWQWLTMTTLFLLASSRSQSPSSQIFTGVMRSSQDALLFFVPSLQLSADHCSLSSTISFKLTLAAITLVFEHPAWYSLLLCSITSTCKKDVSPLLAWEASKLLPRAKNKLQKERSWQNKRYHCKRPSAPDSVVEHSLSNAVRRAGHRCSLAERGDYNLPR